MTKTAITVRNLGKCYRISSLQRRDDTLRDTMGQRECQVITLREPLRVLRPDRICQIDRYLAELTTFGRMTLIKRGGRLGFIERTESIDSIPPPAGATLVLTQPFRPAP